MPVSAPPSASASPDVLDAPWAATQDTVFEAYDTAPEGLSEPEVTDRRRRYGPNALREIERVSAWVLLANQLASLVVLLLAAAAAVSFAFGDFIEAAAIGVVLVVNTGIGFVMEWRAVRSMEALQKLDRVPAVVRRSGSPVRLSAEEIVPGDIVLLDEGDVITADLRLIETSKLQVDESALTGESVPVDKHEDPVSEETPLADRACMAYKGTAVTRGSGAGVVVSTGMNTELGDISSLVESADQDATPLEDRLDQLARSLVVVVLVLAAVVAGVGFYAGRDPRLMIEMGIALAVAAVPEGLPVVATIALARGLRRMARRNALVRRLSSVETLGATSVICTDKTGTLTENRMTVRRLLLPDGPDGLRVESIDETDPSDATGDGQRSASTTDDAALTLAAWVSALCNTASLADDDPLSVVGDPMEGALLQFALRLGHSPRELTRQLPETDRVAFERATKMMASLRQSDSGPFVAVKGAPEAVLSASSHEVGAPGASGAGAVSSPLDLLSPSAVRPLDDGRRQVWLEANERLAKEGLRVLALAAKRTETASTDDDAVYNDLSFLGLVGLVDPPREDVKDAIQACQRAGIRVVMVTGDQAPTAQYVANAVGLQSGEGLPVVHGSDFDHAFASDPTQAARSSIFARVTPRQKLELIDHLQADGSVVAMTGDGVNDAPALKSADIGVAMGQRGTQVAQEAADVVLQDDAFSTIVAAVEEGRTIFNNIRAFVRYLLSCNVGEVMAVGTAALLGLPLPLLPLQILFLNLVTDVFPALALGMGEAETDVLESPPRPADESVVTRRHWTGIALYGVVFAASVLGSLLLARWGLGFSSEDAVTVSFLVLAFGQLWHVFNMRSPGAHPLRNVVVQNGFVWAALGLCTALLGAAVYVPTFAQVLSLSPPSPTGWLLVAGGSLLPLFAGQIGLAVLAARSQPATSPA